MEREGTKIYFEAEGNRNARIKTIFLSFALLALLAVVLFLSATLFWAVRSSNDRSITFGAVFFTIIALFYIWITIGYLRFMGMGYMLDDIGVTFICGRQSWGARYCDLSKAEPLKLDDKFNDGLRFGGKSKLFKLFAFTDVYRRGQIDHVDFGMLSFWATNVPDAVLLRFREYSTAVIVLTPEQPEFFLEEIQQRIATAPPSSENDLATDS